MSHACSHLWAVSPSSPQASPAPLSPGSLATRGEGSMPAAKRGHRTRDRPWPRVQPSRGTSTWESCSVKPERSGGGTRAANSSRTREVRTSVSPTAGGAGLFRAHAVWPTLRQRRCPGHARSCAEMGHRTTKKGLQSPRCSWTGQRVPGDGGGQDGVWGETPNPSPGRAVGSGRQ